MKFRTFPLSAPLCCSFSTFPEQLLASRLPSFSQEKVFDARHRWATRRARPGSALASLELESTAQRSEFHRRSVCWPRRTRERKFRWDFHGRNCSRERLYLQLARLSTLLARLKLNCCCCLCSAPQRSIDSCLKASNCTHTRRMESSSLSIRWNPNRFARCNFSDLSLWDMSHRLPPRSRLPFVLPSTDWCCSAHKRAMVVDCKTMQFRSFYVTRTGWPSGPVLLWRFQFSKQSKNIL